MTERRLLNCARKFEPISGLTSLLITISLLFYYKPFTVMASIGYLRAFLLPLIASCALVGGYAGMYTINRNGTGESIKNTAGRAVEPYIPGGVHPFKNTYTGISGIDGMLLMLVPFFAYILDTPQSWAITASLWYLLTQFLAACCLLFLEGARRGNSGRLVSW